MLDSLYMPYKKKIYLSSERNCSTPVWFDSEVGDTTQAISPYLKRDIDNLEGTKRVDERFFKGLTYEGQATAIQFATLKNRG